MINPRSDSDKNKPEDGLDKWNNRLDENLEQSNHNDIDADKKAKEYSEQFENKPNKDE